MLKIRKVDFSIALKFSIYIKFQDLLFFNWLDEFATVLLALVLLLLITLLLSTQNAFEANSDDLIIFNKKASNIAILLKFWIKR